MVGMFGMEKRFDQVFPEAGGLEHLKEVRTKFIERLDNRQERAGNTFFHPKEAEHVRKALTLLGDDEEAKATIVHCLAFAQMKSDVAKYD